MRVRRTVRIVPKRPITSALERAGAPFAYGVVANISAGGACIWTNARLDAGRSVALRLSFPKGSQPLDAEGIVVWGGASREASTEGLRYGLQWSGETPGHQQLLTRMILDSA